MTSNVVAAWQGLMKRREDAAAALAAIDREIAEVREILALGSEWPSPAVMAPKPRKNPLRERLKAARGSTPAADPAVYRVGDRSRAACAAVVKALERGPLSRRELVAATKLRDTQVTYAASVLSKQRVIVRSGTGPLNYKFSLRVPPAAESAPAPAPARSACSDARPSSLPRSSTPTRRHPADDGLEVVFSGRQSLTGAGA